MNIEPMSDSGTLSQGPFGENLTTGWQLCESPAGAWPDPEALLCAMAANPDQRWISCEVPGTVAQALYHAGRYDPQAPQPLHGLDFWYRREMRGDGVYGLHCDGLATLAQVFLDGKLVGESSSMYLPLILPMNLRGSCVLHIVFRSLTAHLAGLKPPRARWRVAMVPDQNLRAVRTTLLGHMPSWCPEIHMVGPWQAIRLIPAQAISQVKLYATVCGEGGVVSVELTCADDLEGLNVACAGAQATLRHLREQTYVAQVDIDQAERWWPQGMGAQALYEVSLQRPEAAVVLGKVGFRCIVLDQGVDGRDFALIVNGVKMFARGAVYTPPNMLHPGGEEGLVQRLDLLAGMGANMLRVAGPFCYESTVFYRRCDELGLLVWQDLMLANFDYPLTDPIFAATLEKEIEALLRRIAGSPSLAVLCGGSEIHQQAAMLGLRPERRRLEFFSQEFPAICARLAPELIVVANSPTGGELPFSVREGVSHYFGVGAYERSLDDARRASPRFVTECLAFSNVPEPMSLEALGAPAVHHPQWKTGVPRDRAASWDFEDTRDHYVGRVFGLNPAELRRSNPAHYLNASRAVIAQVIGSTLGEWRRPASPTRGVFVFTAGDLRPGAGWGLIDVSGEPKSAYYAFRQAAKSLALFLTDEGCDGLDIHLVNDESQAYRLMLELRVLRQGSIEVARGNLAVDVPARAGMTIPATRVLGAFFDLTYAFRFGEPGHDAVVVSACDVMPDAHHAVLLDACFFPAGPYGVPCKLGLRADLFVQDGCWWLELSTDVVARFVHIDDRTYRPQDNYFHLPPGVTKRVRLIAREGKQGDAPHGMVAALNSLGQISYRGSR